MRYSKIARLVVVGFVVASAQVEAQETEAATRQYASAVGFQNQKLFDAAIDEWHLFLSKFPEDARSVKARHYLGTCCLQEKQYDAAIEAFEKVVAVGPRFELLEQSLLNLGISRYAKAQTSSRKTDYERAARDFDRLLKRFPSTKYADRALYYRAESLFQSDEEQQSISSYSELVKRFPNSEFHADALYGLGTALEAIDSNQKAEEAFSQFTNKYPSHRLVTEVRMRQADILFGKEQYSDAAPVFAAIRKDKTFELADVAMIRHARCLYEMGDIDEAAQLYWNVPREFRDTSHYDAAILAGAKCYYMLEKYSTARNGLEKLVDRVLRSRFVITSLGGTLAHGPVEGEQSPPTQR